MNHGLGRLRELPVSARLIREIHDQLRAVRGHGDWEGWLGFCPRGVAEVNGKATETTRRVRSLTHLNSGPAPNPIPQPGVSISASGPSPSLRRGPSRSMIPLSILELGRVREGSTRRAALEEARTLAQHAEDWGYRRFWVAEHHNAPGVSTAATPVVIAYIAAGTRSIRVGAGGVMLPNHPPYVVAEQFGTLETLFPGRIDLGLGRAPGMTAETLHALRRDATAVESYPTDVRELRDFLGPVAPGQLVEAVPGSGTRVPIWILGSSLFGARLAAELGLPFGFAAHFAPGSLDAALSLYRERFSPSEECPEPYVLLGANIIAGESDAHARRLWTSQQMSLADFLRGGRHLFRPPIDDIENYWNVVEKAQASKMLECSIVGGPETVRRGMDALLQRTEVDELLVVSDMFDAEERLRSFQRIAQVAGEVARGARASGDPLALTALPHASGLPS